MVRKEKNGTYTVITYASDGRQVWRRGIATKKQALSLEFEIKNGPAKALDMIKMSDLAGEFLKHQATTLSIGSFKSNESRYNNHIKPYLSDKTVQKVTQKDILDVIYAMRQSKKNYSAVYINKILEVMSSIFQFGIDLGYIKDNPCKSVRRLKDNDNEEALYMTIEDYKKISANLSSDRLAQIFIELLFFTGIRLGEARALLWSQFDWEKNSISINAHVVDKGARRRVPGRKNNRNYIIIMPSNVRETLYEHFLNEKNKDGFSLDRYVFGFYDSWSYNRIYRAFKRALVKSEVNKPYKIHSFRHGYASLLANAGASLQELSVALGDTLEVTIQTYTHMYHDVPEIISQRVNQIIKSDSSFF